MAFAPDITERLARARADLRMGVPVVLDGGALVLAAETWTERWMQSWCGPTFDSARMTS